MKIELDINQQNALFVAYTQMDTYEATTLGVENGPKSVKVPYKMGAARRIVTKNVAKLKASLQQYEETHKALIKEIWPDKEEGATIKNVDDPEKFKQFTSEQKKILETKEEFDLLPLPKDVMYENGNDFPIRVLLVLDEHGLIEE